MIHVKVIIKNNFKRPISHNIKKRIKTFLCFSMYDPEISFNSQYLRLGILDVINTIQVFFLATQCGIACRILVHIPRIKSTPPALEAWTL